MFTILPWILTFISLLFAARCYRELWKWAKQCQRAEIAVAYNGKVRFRGTLVEWLTWVNKLPKDTTGQTVFRMNKMSVSIIRRNPMTAKTTVKTINSHRNSRKAKVAA